jgi:hypothetical protein
VAGRDALVGLVGLEGLLPGVEAEFAVLFGMLGIMADQAIHLKNRFDVGHKIHWPGRGPDRENGPGRDCFEHPTL